jgi:hypothetical protein
MQVLFMLWCIAGSSLMLKRCGGGEKAPFNASDTASKLQCMEQVNVKKMRWG